MDNAVIGGLMYNQGETELNGKIIGYTYTQKFDLKAGGGRYSNFLLDATLSAKQLPSDFIVPHWLKDETATTPKIIACF